MPTPTRTPQNQAGHRSGFAGTERSVGAGAVGTAASTTRLNHAGPAAVRTPGVASTVADGSARAASAAPISGSVSRRAPGGAPTLTSSTQGAAAAAVVASSTNACTT